MLRTGNGAAAAEGAGAALAAGGGHVHEHGLFQGVDHYQKAQEALGFPLLHSVTGGRGGGGAELTPEAVRMMAAYDDYCRKLRAYADDLFQEEFGYLQEENGDL